jgi:Calcineurin-like phosphoesterase
MFADGFGDVTSGDGEPYQVLTTDGAPPPAPGPNAKMLVRFIHFADVQLTDDESPMRLANLDNPVLGPGAFRPQEGHGCRIANAMVRTINGLHRDAPIDFVLLGGDNIDNAQSNELSWMLELLGGSDGLECDSGIDDDPTPGAANDHKDPFAPEGLAMPYYWVTGNHDVLRQGNLTIDDQAVQLAVGTEAPTGTRDWSQAGGPLIVEGIVSDDGRMPLLPNEVLERVAADGDGHGIGAEQVAAGKANYTFDVPGTPLRFIVIDTATDTGGDEGMIRQAVLDDFILPALEQAQADGKWVLLTSHHATHALSTDGGALGSEQPDAVEPNVYVDAISGFDNVLFSIAGHSHVHRMNLIEQLPSHSFWELQTSAVADFPAQSRVIELWDQDNGYVMLQSAAFDFATEGDDSAAEGRALGVLDFVSGWGEDGRGNTEDRNIQAWIAVP